MNDLATAAWIADASSLARMGLKGSAAADWLERAQLQVPAQANSWASIEPDGGPSSWSLIARLGMTEFFIEADPDSAVLRNLAQALGGGGDRVYPVLREDRAFVLGGTDPESVLAQVCNVNFASLALESNPVVLTLITGVAVVVLPQRERAGRRYRIWCDPSFGRYLWNTLKSIVVESGGREIGIEQLRKQAGGQQ